MSITYQQAKRIRKSSLSGLISDQLLYEKSIGTAVKKAVSLKTRGTIMGITQKFDPLNIAKFLTFGSSIGPALLGHMTGRDPRDIEYFTGRLKPIRENTAARIGRVPSGGGGSGDLNSVLRKIYTLMKASHEDEIKRLELSKNLDEEKKLEEAKRHKELLEAITGKSGGTATPVKERGDGLFGSLMGMIGDAVKGIKDWVEKFVSSFDFMKVLSNIFGGMRLFGTLLRFLASPIFRFLTSPAMLMVGGILALAELLKWAVGKVDNMNVLTPEDAAHVLATGSERDIESFGGEEKLKDIITNGATNAQRILDTGDEELITKSGGQEFLEKSATQTDIQVPTERNRLEKVEPRPDTNGGTMNLQRAKNWDMKFGDKFYPDGTRKTEIPQDESSNNVEMTKLQRQASGPSGVPVSNTDNLGAKLNTSQSENLSGRMTEGKLIRASTKQVSETNITKSTKSTPVKKALPSVRNHEESFSRMIFESTRVV